MKIITTLITFLVFSSITLSQVQGVKYHAFSTTLVLTVEGGATLELSDFKGSKFDYLGKASLEYFLPSYSRGSFGFRAFAGAGYISGRDQDINPSTFRTEMQYFGGGVVYLLSLNEYLYPYFFAGASYMMYDPIGPSGNKLPNNAAGVYKNEEINYNGELGLRILITDDLSFNVNGGVHIHPNDYLDDNPLGTNNDAFLSFSGGFSFAFFTEKDADNDGVLDSKDLCGNTPAGVEVDDFGCPVDTDKDGVPDYRDECPDTPFRVPVDRRGCPVDSDGDGVYDYNDICPETPKGVKVDKMGCPIDSDGDGVADYKDDCPNTPKNAPVNEEGCPLDSDLDGVPDYKDDCPGTAPGKQVDEYGCELEEEVKEVILSSGTNFAFGSADLLPSAYPELDKLIEVMKRNPSTRWRIEGHTDNIGSNEANKKVSLARAQSVLEYLVAGGISISRFEVVGLGEDYPIASNSTEEGRAANRRVAIIRIN